MSMRHIGARVPEQLDDALEEASRDARTSKSEMIRHYLEQGLLEDDVDLPDHMVRQVKREKMKRENRLAWQRIHFRSNVADRFKRAFEQGDLDGEMGDSAVDDLTEIHVEDARELFVDEDRKEKAVQFVKAVGKHAKEASNASDFDRLNPEEMWERYGGVADGRAKEKMDVLVDTAKQRLTEGVQISHKDLATALSNEYDVSKDVAKQAVKQAADTGNGGSDVTQANSVSTPVQSQGVTQANKSINERADELVSQGVTSVRKLADTLLREYPVDDMEATQVAGNAVNSRKNGSSNGSVNPNDVINLPDSVTGGRL